MQSAATPNGTSLAGAVPHVDGTLTSPRPRALIVGPLACLPETERLRAALDLAMAAPEELIGALQASAPDVVLLDGTLPAPQLAGPLAALSERADRPAVLLVAPCGGPSELAGLLDGHADDVVNGALGEQELLDRVRNALRVRGILAELNRKNLELAALYDRLETLAGRMAEELRLASNVQRSLMPPPLHHPRLEVAREFIPFREIGGDYYDLVPLGPDRLAFAIGDVMGKGVPAALLAANLKAGLRAQLQSGEATPCEVVSRVNRLFWEVTPRGLFASLFFGIFDLERGRLTYVNAGHDPPFVVRPDGSVRDLTEGGTVLGLVEESRYEHEEVRIERDDLLVFYSDGVTDRGSREGELFGVDHLKEAATHSRSDAARIVLYSLLGEVQGWSGGAPADDDMTLVVARVR